MNQPTRIFITGSSGYVGNFLALYFAKQAIEVIGFDIRSLETQKHIPHFTFFQGDIRDGKSLTKLIAEQRPSHIIHLAYFMEPQHDKKLEYEVDVLGSQNILNAANIAPSVKQFILFSSTSIYGAHPDNPEWLTETAPLKPHDYTYAIYKKEIEGYYQQFSKRSDLKLVILRMTTAVGPSYYKSGGVVSSFTKAPFALRVNGIDTRVQFIHEDDVKEFVKNIINDAAIQGTFNLCPDSYTTILVLANGQNKRTITIPLFLLKTIFWFLWNLRVAALTPAIARLMTYSIVADPAKLQNRYHYQFRYSARNAFEDAVIKRRQNGTL